MSSNVQVKALWNGDYEGMMKILGKLSAEDLKARLEKRETKLNMSAVFHVVLGARAASNPDLLFQICMPITKVRKNHKKMLQKLIELGANVNVKNLAGSSPLCLSSDLDIARFLLEAGADPNSRNRMGQLPLFMSIARQELDMVGLLLQYGADPDLKTSGIQGSQSGNQSSRELAATMGPRVMNKLNPQGNSKRAKQSKETKEVKEKLDSELEGKVCETSGCKNPAALRCPQCKKLGIQGSLFCSQACFNSSWASHKQVHKKVRKEQEAAEEKQVDKMLAELGLDA